MRPLLYILICLFCLISYSLEGLAQKRDRVFYGNDPVGPEDRPKPKPDPIEDISQEFLDELGLKSVSVETHVGYCDGAKPVIITHREYGKAVISNPGPGCPLIFSFVQPAEEVHLKFTGCKGKYKLVGYDEFKNKVAESTAEINLWETGVISIQSETPNIAYITFARGPGCSTYMKGIQYH